MYVDLIPIKHFFHLTYTFLSHAPFARPALPIAGLPELQYHGAKFRDSLGHLWSEDSITYSIGSIQGSDRPRIYGAWYDTDTLLVDTPSGPGLVSVAYMLL